MNSARVALLLVCSLGVCRAFQTSALPNMIKRNLNGLRASSRPSDESSDSGRKGNGSPDQQLLNRRALIQTAISIPFLSGTAVHAAGILEGAGQTGWGDATKA